MRLMTIFLIALTTGVTAIATPVSEEPPELTYMYTFNDSYLRDIISTQLGVTIKFAPTPWSATNPCEVEKLLLLSNDLPDVFSLTCFSPRRLYDWQNDGSSKIRSIPKSLIMQYMPEYTELFTDNDAWHRLAVSSNDLDQIALGGYLYDNQFSVFSLVARRHLSGTSLGGEDEGRDLLNLKAYSAGGNLSISDVENALSVLSTNDMSFWVGPHYQLSPLYSAFGLSSVAGSVLFGYDENRESNFANGRLNDFLDTMRMWSSKNYLHPHFMDLGFLDQQSRQPIDDSKIGMMTTNLRSLGYVSGGVGGLPSLDGPPLSWTQEPDSDVVVLDAPHLLSRPDESLFLTSNIQHELFGAEVDDLQLSKALEIFELVRLSDDTTNGLGYWMKWVFGEPAVHHTLRQDGKPYANYVIEVTDKRYSSFLTDRNDHEFATYHFKIPPLFRTSSVSQVVFEDSFLSYIRSAEWEWSTLPAFWGADPCNVVPVATRHLRERDVIFDEHSLIGRAILNPTDSTVVILGLIEEAVAHALNDC